MGDGLDNATRDHPREAEVSGHLSIRPKQLHWAGASRFIIVLMLVFVAKQVFSVAAFYPFSGHDELAHFSYVRTLATEGRIPVLPDLKSWRSELIGGVPPPTDEIPAELYAYCRFALDWYCEPDNPRWRSDPPRVVTVPGWGYFPSGYQYVANHPPLYYAAMAPVFLLSSSLSPLLQQYLLRLAAIPFGLITVYAAYRTVRALFPGDAFLTVTASATVALQPQIGYESAMVNNDIVAIAATSLLIWGIVVGMRDRFPIRLCLGMGMVLGAGLLAKGTTVTMAPVVALAVLLGVGWRDWRGWMSRGVAVAVPAMVIAAPWYAFLYKTYGDLSGLQRVDALQYWNHPMGSFLGLLLNPGFVVARFRETWGEYGWRLIHLSDSLLWAIGIPTIAGLLGLVVFVVRAKKGASLWRGEEAPRLTMWQVKALVALAGASLLAYLAVIQFGTSFALAQARYFFPVVNAATILVMLGLRTLIPDRFRPAGQGIVLGGLIMLNVVIMSAYVLPFTVTVDEPAIPWFWNG